MRYLFGFCRRRIESPLYYVVIVLAAVLLGVFNAFLGYANAHVFHLPLFLDTIGTLVSVSLFGLIPGLITALVTHLTPDLFPFMADDYMFWVFCNFASAITLWLFIRTGRFLRVLYVLLVTVVVSLVNALVGSAVAVFFFSGITDHPVDYMMTGFISIGRGLFSAAFWARIPVNLIDKGIAVLIAFLLYRWCWRKKSDDEAFS
ncbi:MAG: hypothetical protein U5P10_00550 [Spirochaetia bacterium]|nr:hypothetical protein [Spirochaetia bacterium]